MTTIAKQTILVNETKAEYEYDRQHALAAWETLQGLIPTDDTRGYTEYPAMSDDDRIILCFELLEGSQFGDMIFGSLANDSQGSTLIERGEDG